MLYRNIASEDFEKKTFNKRCRKIPIFLQALGTVGRTGQNLHFRNNPSVKM